VIGAKIGTLEGRKINDLDMLEQRQRQKAFDAVTAHLHEAMQFTGIAPLGLRRQRVAQKARELAIADHRRGQGIMYHR
jgi:hypothetical protein